MFAFRGSDTRLCDGWSRREWLRVGGLGAFGVSLANLLEAQAGPMQVPPTAISSSFGKAKRCIVLFLLGGPPQHETWDPKPEAPAEIRGEFSAISTATAGLQVGELMPRTAKLTERIAVLRAMSTADNAHSSSGYWMLTGYPHAPKNSENALPGAPNHRPCMAAVARHLKGDQTCLPGAVRLPEEIWNTGHIVWPGQDAGWLGDQADPWLLTCDPNQDDFRAPDISLPVDISPERTDAAPRFADTDEPADADARWGFDSALVKLADQSSGLAADRRGAAGICLGARIYGPPRALWPQSVWPKRVAGEATWWSPVFR